MNCNRESCRPIYSQQQATSAFQANNLSFKRTTHYNIINNNKCSMTLNLKKNRLLIMHILPGNFPDYLIFRHGLRKIVEVQTLREDSKSKTVIIKAPRQG